MEFKLGFRFRYINRGWTVVYIDKLTDVAKIMPDDWEGSSDLVVYSKLKKLEIKRIYDHN